MKTAADVPPLPPIDEEMATPRIWHESEDLAVLPLAEMPEEPKPTNPKTLTPKMTSVGLGGFSSATVITWLKARFDLEITVEDVAVILPLVTLVAGYFTKEFRERLTVQRRS